MARIIQRLRELDAQNAARDHEPAEGHADPELAPLANPLPLEIPALDADHPAADLLEQTHVRPPAGSAERE